MMKKRTLAAVAAGVLSFGAGAPPGLEWLDGPFAYVGTQPSSQPPALQCPERLELGWTGDALAGSDPGKPLHHGRWIEAPQVNLGVQKMRFYQLRTTADADHLTVERRHCRPVLGLWTCAGVEWLPELEILRTPEGFEMLKQVYLKDKGWRSAWCRYRR